MYNAVNTRRTGDFHRPAAQLPESQFAALLSAIRDSEHRLDRKLADFKAEIQQAQDEAATKAVNRVRNDKPYHYKKKALEEQSRFNAQVEESVQNAHDARCHRGLAGNPARPRGSGKRCAAFDR